MMVDWQLFEVKEGYTNPVALRQAVLTLLMTQEGAKERANVTPLVQLNAS